jgi:hypothetical protein
MKEMLATELRWPEVAAKEDIHVHTPVFNRENEESAERVKAHVLGVEGVHPIQQLAA